MCFHNGSLRSQFVIKMPLKFKQKLYKYEDMKIYKHEEMEI